MIIKGYVFGIGYAALCLLLSLVLYKLGLPKKYTRKVVHILVGFEWFILYHYMGAGIHFLSVCILFLVLLSIAYKGKLMPMIASDDDNAPGTVYYAAAMTGVAAVGCFLPAVMLPFGVGVMCTSLGDGLAGVVGQIFKKVNPQIYNRKTLLGTLTNFIVSSVSAFVISSIYSMDIGIPVCLIIGLVSAELELVTPYGFDNVSITWATTAITYAYMYFSGINDYIIPIIATPLIIIFATSKKALTLDGVVAALILDFAVSVAFGNSGFLILSFFFVGAVIVDKIKNGAKNKGRKENDSYKDCRNYMQVVANGLVPFASVTAFVITKNNLFAVSFVASVAEAFSDTVASGLGAFATRTYDPFKRRRCENGISGGMSIVGTSASFVAACLISFAAFIFNVSGYGVKEFFVVLFSAFIGTVFDSFLGSVVQVKYQCDVCGCITESEHHCGVKTMKSSGVSVIDNDVVNIISSAISAIIAVTLVIFI